MFVKYNGRIYRWLDKKDYCKIITCKKEKATPDFYQNEDVYVKKVLKSDINIEDVYNIKFFLNYESHLEKVDKEWEIFSEKEYLREGGVLLRFAKGLLPDWKTEEQTVCSKYVDIKECYGFRAVYTYFVKDGKKLDGEVKVKKHLTEDEFTEMVIGYGNSNI